jgi:hypothetical protein
MSQGVREANRRADRLEAALREAQKRNEAVEHALLSTGPLRRLLRLYDDLDLAADPMKGRSVEGGGGQHPFDRPMPHLSTVEARELQRIVDRALFRICDVVADWLNSSEPKVLRNVCPGCGGQTDRSGRPPNRRLMARLFLEKNLQGGGPVSEETVRWAAQSLGIARDTLRRAADELRVRRFEADGVWWWQLKEER